MKKIFYKALALVAVATISIAIQLHPAGFYFGVGHGGGHNWQRYRRRYHRRHRHGFGLGVLFSNYSRSSWNYKVVRAIQDNDKELDDHGRRIINLEAEMRAHREALEKLLEVK